MILIKIDIIPQKEVGRVKKVLYTVSFSVLYYFFLLFERKPQVMVKPQN